MFWRQHSGSAVASPIEELLAKGAPTLQQVLGEDSVIQECKACNAKLLAFLQRSDVLDSLIATIVSSRTGSNEAEASTACEILCCDLDDLLTTLLTHRQGALFYRLLDFLRLSDSDSLHPPMAGRFTSALRSIFSRRNGEVVELLRWCSDLIGTFTRTIGNDSSVDLLTRLVCADEWLGVGYEDARDVFASKGLVSSLTELLSVTCSEHERLNASEALCAIARGVNSPLCRELASSPNIGSVVSLALPRPDPSHGSVQALEVLVALLDPQHADGVPALTTQSPWEDPNPWETQKVEVEFVSPYHEVVSEVASRAPEMAAVLNTPPTGQHTAQSSAASQPVGPLRLKVAEAVAALVRARDGKAAQSLQQANVMEALIQLSFVCPYNSMAHHALERTVCGALDWEGSDLAHHIVYDCKLPHRLASVQRHLPTHNGRVARSGFMGHIVRMSDKLEDMLGDDLQASEEWQAFADGELTDVRDASNTSAWECGRPPRFEECAESIEFNEDAFNDDGYSAGHPMSPQSDGNALAPFVETFGALQGGVPSLAAKAFLNDDADIADVYENDEGDRQAAVGDEDERWASDAFFDASPVRLRESEDEVLHLSDSDEEEDPEGVEDEALECEADSDGRDIRSPSAALGISRGAGRHQCAKSCGETQHAGRRPPTPSPAKRKSSAEQSCSEIFNTWRYWRVNPFEDEDSENA